MKKYLRPVIALLRTMGESGSLEPVQTKAIAKSLKELDHALRIGDLERVEALINELARIFIRLN